MNDLRRFWDKVRPQENGCWLWTASLNAWGYGSFWDGARVSLAHRFAYESFIGPIPDGLQIDHLCRVRSCVNPAHLEAVTQAENVRRGNGGKNWAAKTHCPQGHPYDAANTYRWRGGRSCRACGREKQRRHRSKSKRELVT